MQRIRPKHSEVFRLFGDNSRMHSLTGFVQRFDLRQGLEITCNWFSQPDNNAKYKPEIYNI